MKVALVNTNRCEKSRVVPVGLEYLAGPLECRAHEVVFCDLAFSENPAGDLCSFLDDEKPGAVGLTVRNLDTAVYLDNRFFLDEIAGLVSAVKAHTDAPVIAGGAATLCVGEGLRGYIGADHLVSGPGECALPEVVDALADGSEPPAVVDGWALGIQPEMSHGRGRLLDYEPYLKDGNPVGLEFRKGCDWDCPFCVERKRPVMCREVRAVVREARGLAEVGARMVFICDSEFNLDLEQTNGLLDALADAEMGMEWTGYFRPVPFDGKMSRRLAAVGFRRLTLSVNSRDMTAVESRYSADDVAAFCRLCGEEGIKVAVDLLVGCPGESPDSVLRAIDVLAEIRPATVGVVPHIRLYERCPVTRKATEAGVGGQLLGETGDNPHMLKPVFYSGVDVDLLLERISSDALFVLEGTERTLNFQRI